MANVYDNISVSSHLVAESSQLKATVAGHIYSLKAISDTDNGCIVSIGDWVEDEVFKAKAYATGDKPVLVLTPPLGYNSDKKMYSDEKYFYNATGEIMRCYELYVGDIFKVSEAAVTKITGNSAVTVGNYVSVSSGKYQEFASAPTSGFVGQLLEKNNGSYYIRVVALGC